MKHEQSIDCGGGYIKLFPSKLNQEDMHGDSVYNIMFGKWTKGWCLKWYYFCWINRAVSVCYTQTFTVTLYLWARSGPDICGPGTKKVHVIFNYKGKNHLINKDIRCKVTHVFTFK